MPGVFYRQYQVQNYQNIKTSTITMGAKWGENQKGMKFKKLKSGMNSGTGKAILQVAKQDAKISQSCSISSALLFASLFFWFLICSYELSLDSPWLS